jgi:hypothetical protein
MVRDKLAEMGVTIIVGKLKELQEVPTVTSLHPPQIWNKIT